MFKKDCYEKIVPQLVAYKRDIRVDTRLSSSDIDEFMHYIKAVDPSLFHVGGMGISASMIGGMVLHPQYIYTEAEYTSLKKQISDKIRPVKQYLRSMATDREKEKYVHDYLCKTVRYVDNGDVSHRLVGPILYGEGVCDGISQSAQLLFKACGVKSFVVTGEAQNGAGNGYYPHAWNVVCVDGKWYHLDVTFDLSKDQSHVQYGYFNLDNKQILVDHKVTFTPMDWKRECIHANDYYVDRKICFDDIDTLKRYYRHVLGKKKTFFQFRMSSPYSDALHNEIISAWSSTVCEMSMMTQAKPTYHKSRNTYFFEVTYV